MVATLLKMFTSTIEQKNILMVGSFFVQNVTTEFAVRSSTQQFLALLVDWIASMFLTCLLCLGAMSALVWVHAIMH